MKKTGTLLKNKRESSNLSLSEVALATKINPKVLNAIENGDEKNLPAKTFLKGFVKSYALFLKMDLDEVMNTFQDEMGGPKPSVTHPVDQPKTASSQSSRRRVGDENSSGLRTIAVIVIVVLIGMIIGVRELIEKYQRERVVESPVALKVTPVEIPKTEEKVAEAPAAAATEEAAAPAEAAKEAEVPVEAAKPVEPPKVVEAAKPVETVKPTEPAKPVENAEAAKNNSVNGQSYPAFKPETKPIVIPTAVFPNLVELKPKQSKTEPAAVEAAKPAEATKPDATAAAVTPTSALKAVKNEIILEALDKVDVKFEVKGEVKKFSLAPTQVHTIRADQPLTLDFSDGGAVNIILNGTERGVPGDLGKPATIKIP